MNLFAETEKCAQKIVRMCTKRILRNCCIFSSSISFTYLSSEKRPLVISRNGSRVGLIAMRSSGVFDL